MKTCTRCNAELNDEALWCSECDQQQPYELANAARDFPTSVVFLGLLVLITGIVLLFVAGRDSRQDDVAADVPIDVATTTTVEDDPVFGALAGSYVLISTPDFGERAEGFVEAMEMFENERGIEIDVEQDLNLDRLASRIEDGYSPGIAIVQNPFAVEQLGGELEVVPLSGQVRSLFADNFGSAWMDHIGGNGELYGVPIRANFHGLVWYSPRIWEERGYEVPSTWAELEDLVERMRENDHIPWGVGIESGSATGWVFGSWLQSLMLRLHGTEVYEMWLRHEIPFDDPRVAEAVEMIDTMWFTEGNIAGTREDVVSERFAESGFCVATGQCMMHVQGGFYHAFLSEWDLGPDADVYFFPLPAVDASNILTASGPYAVAFDSSPEVMAVMEYLVSAEFADDQTSRVRLSLSANRGQDRTLYSTEIEADLAATLHRVDVVGVDMTGAIPIRVLERAFWPAATEFVAGTMTAAEFLAAVEDAWDD